MFDTIEPGCWVTSKRFGPAVCVALPTEDDPDLFTIRYEARHLQTQQPIWVLNGDDKVEFLRPADEVSLQVIKLTGPYGLGNDEHVGDPRFHPDINLPSTKQGRTTR